MAETANPALSKAHETVKVVVVADPADCSFQFNPTGTATFTNSCDVAKGALARASVRLFAAGCAGREPRRRR